MSVTNAQLSDAGRYKVSVTNAFARLTSAEAVFTVDTPVTISRQPVDVAALQGSNATFTVGAVGFGTLGYQWFKDGQLIRAAISPSLQLIRVQSSDAGDYFARVLGQFGGATSSVARLIVNVPPAIQVQPQSQTISDGAMALLSSEVIGTLPLSYRWFKNDGILPNATNGTVEIPNAQFAAQGSYRFIVTNAFGAATSVVARVTVNAAPGIRVQPMDQTTGVRANATFIIEVDGSLPLSYQWFKDQDMVVGATNRVLPLFNLQLSDDAYYRVTVNNAYGRAESSSAKLTVGSPVSISLQPLSQTVPVGASVTFSAEAEGLAPLNYQWLKNGDAIRGATNSTLPLSALKVRDAGKYAMTASNRFGQARSIEAILIVRTPLTTKGDFNHDNSPDIVLQDQSGLLGLWYMTGTDLASAGLLVPSEVGQPGWNIVASGDFNEDGNEDLVLQHRDGTLAIWFMNGRILLSGSLVSTPWDRSDEWRVVATGDFDQNGKTDLVIQSKNRSLAVGFMNGINIASMAQLNSGNPIESEWTVVGASDFNEDGKTDLVFQHQNGTLATWYLDGTTTSSAALFTPNRPSDAQWRVVSITDRNADGKPGLLFQHLRNGTLAVWFMDGPKLTEVRLINPSAPGGTWRVVAP
ncbi:MAG: hypothetical protein EXS30_08785 [Pedosphaera sp.]|nr:hypothetical protein [Pedosphaera sp.]